VTWLNVDKPTRKCIPHPDDGCLGVTIKSETANKGISKLNRDGVWLSFHTDTATEDWCNKNSPSYRITPCPYCEAIQEI
jgi:hypothetical protein